MPFTSLVAQITGTGPKPPRPKKAAKKAVRGRPRLPMKISMAELIRRHAAGETWWALSQATGLQPSTVYQRLKAAGVEPKREKEKT